MDRINNRNIPFTKYRHDSEKHTEVPMHAHTNGQINYVKTGIMQLVSPDTVWMIPQQRIVWVPPDQPHAVRCGKISGSWKIMTPRSYGKFLPETICVLRTSVLLIAALDALPLSGTAISPEKLELLTRLIRLELLSAESESFGVRLPKSERFRDLTETLLRQPEDSRRIDDWAKIVGMSRRTFTRNFISETGVSFGKWKKDLVLGKALKLLTEGKNVSEVADHLGYSNPSAFIAAFRLKYGNPPFKYLQK